MEFCSGLLFTLTNEVIEVDNIKLRIATVDDAEELLQIYKPYVENTAITFEYEVPDCKEFAQRIVNTLKTYPYIIAVKYNEILGYAYASTFKDRAAYDWAIETSIYIKSDVRHSGIGTKLYDCLEKLLKTQGILNANACIAYLETEEKHLPADSTKFHEHFGFKLVGVFHKCGYKFEKWYDMIWMEKLIGEHSNTPNQVRKISQLSQAELKSAGLDI